MILTRETEIQKPYQDQDDAEAYKAHEPRGKNAEPQDVTSSIRKISLGQSVSLLGALRKFMRGALFSFIKKLAHTDDARDIAAEALVGLSGSESKEVVSELKNEVSPYLELGRGLDVGACGNTRDVIIITARFRSGSTLLWNLFRNTDAVTAYYEPFNERRWFDPAARGDRIDSTHRGVSEYWREYDGLAELANYYHEEWTYRNLFMDEHVWNPAMKRFIEVLIEKAPGRPVLQFNRIDFRLPWIKHNFPRAKIVHLYRNPRDQWCSSLMEPKCVPADATMSEFRAHDKFYLTRWAADLKYQFPFLDERTISHPYELFYYIWKLSYLFGVKYADHSLQFEELVEKPDAKLIELFRVLDIQNIDLEKLKALVTKVDIGKWQDYANDAWFKRHESACEEVLAGFFAKEKIGGSNTTN
jgi:hypothetical protein